MKKTLAALAFAALMIGTAGGCSAKDSTDDATKPAATASISKPPPVVAATPEKYEKVDLSKASIQLEIKLAADAGGNSSVMIMPSGPGETASTGGQMFSGTVKRFRIHGKDIALETNDLGIQSNGGGDAHTVIRTSAYGEIRVTNDMFKGTPDEYQLWMTPSQKKALGIK